MKHFLPDIEAKYHEYVKKKKFSASAKYWLFYMNGFS